MRKLQILLNARDGQEMGLRERERGIEKGLDRWLGGLEGFQGENPTIKQLAVGA